MPICNQQKPSTISITKPWNSTVIKELLKHHQQNLKIKPTKIGPPPFDSVFILVSVELAKNLTNNSLERLILVQEDEEEWYKLSKDDFKVKMDNFSHATSFILYIWFSKQNQNFVLWSFTLFSMVYWKRIWFECQDCNKNWFHRWKQWCVSFLYVSLVRLLQ